MSRVGKVPVPVPQQVNISLKGDAIEVKGPKGVLRMNLPPRVQVEQQDAQLVVKPMGTARTDRAMHGLARALLANMVIGVTDGFEKVLQIEGVGYRANMEGDTLVMELGFSHSIRYPVPKGVEIKVEKNLVRVLGIDKQHVGDVAADLRAFRPPEPYKGKGVRYQGEYVRRKEGKKNA
jgi:large subunit ribosomal protein L6